MQVNKFWNRYSDQCGTAESSTLTHSLIHCHIFYIYNDPGVLLPNHVAAVGKLTKSDHGSLDRKESKSPSERYSSRADKLPCICELSLKLMGLLVGEEVHTANSELWSSKSEKSLIWSSVSWLYLEALVRMFPSSAAPNCSLRVWGVLLFARELFPHRRRRNIRNGLIFYYNSLIHKSFELNSYYCTLPAWFVKPLKEKLDALCHFLQEA